MGKLIKIREGCLVAASEIVCLIADPPEKPGVIYVRLQCGHCMFVPPDEGKSPAEEVERLGMTVAWLCQ